MSGQDSAESRDLGTAPGTHRRLGAMWGQPFFSGEQGIPATFAWICGPQTHLTTAHSRRFYWDYS